MSALEAELLAHPDLHLQGDKKGLQPLHLGARHGHDGVVGLLAKKGANLTATDHRHHQPMHEAAQNGHTEVVSRLALLRAAVAPKSSTEGQPIHLAAEQGHASVVEILLKQGVTVNAKGQGGGQPMHAAAAAGHTTLVQLLANYRARVGAVQSQGAQPLHFAAQQGHAAVVLALVRLRASVVAEGKSNLKVLQPVHFAVKNGHMSVGALLRRLMLGDSVAAVESGMLAMEASAPNGKEEQKGTQTNLAVAARQETRQDFVDEDEDFFPKEIQTNLNFGPRKNQEVIQDNKQESLNEAQDFFPEEIKTSLNFDTRKHYDLSAEKNQGLLSQQSRASLSKEKEKGEGLLQERTAKDKDGDELTYVDAVFKNPHSKTVYLFWVNGKGEEVLKAAVPARSELDVKTLPGHIWMVRTRERTNSKLLRKVTMSTKSEQRHVLTAQKKAQEEL
eukprot:gnl/MRDRNA2_/MRDRNA2_36259_c0_seq1.p1 gnl/MRDRNA2_/MRDRNA2_36259_c0~~gnl/MRDRNA2_/MRDRNA2_36259_c0_seq1.p1  ORF type:complete len:503 (+),score=118.50 gnl/MRDRNA2_/MRDRNA2_36259_c0_seq1:172-1509(+)